MATYNKFQGFVGYLGLAAVNLNTDTLRVYLSNATPSASLDDVKADLAEIAGGNGYTALGEDIVNTYAEASGTGTLSVGTSGGDVVWTASGGAIAQFQYAAVYDDTHASDILVCWHDYGSAVDVAAGETFTWNSSGTLFTIA